MSRERFDFGTGRRLGFLATRLSKLSGRTLDLIVPESLRARHWEGYNRVMAGGEGRYGEGDVLAVPAVRKDGRRISIEFTVLPMRDDAGGMLGIVAFLRDTTARFEELRALRRELAALKAPTGRE